MFWRAGIFPATSAEHVAISSLASPPFQQTCPSNEEMGQAALDFVGRFEQRSVLAVFEEELRRVVCEHGGSLAEPGDAVSGKGRE